MDVVKDNKARSSSKKQRMKRGKVEPQIGDTIALKPCTERNSKSGGKKEREKPAEGDGKSVRDRRRKRRRIVEDSDVEEDKEEVVVQVVDGHDAGRDSSASDSTRTVLGSKTCDSKTCIPNSDDEDMGLAGESELIEEKKPVSSPHGATPQGKRGYSTSSSRKTSPIARKRQRSVKETSLAESSTPWTPTSTRQRSCLRISLVGCDNEVFAVPISEIPSPTDLQSKITELFRQPPDAHIKLTNDRGDIIGTPFWKGWIWGDGYRMRVEFTGVKTGCPNLSATDPCDIASGDTAKAIMMDAAVQTEEKTQEAIEADVSAKWKEKVKEMERLLEEEKRRGSATIQRLREREKEREKSSDLELRFSQTDIVLDETPKEPESLLDSPLYTPRTGALTHKPRAKVTSDLKNPAPMRQVVSTTSHSGTASKNRTSEHCPPATNVKNSYRKPNRRKADDLSINDADSDLSLDLSYDPKRGGDATTTDRTVAPLISHGTTDLVASSQATVALGTRDATGEVSNNLWRDGCQVNGEGRWFAQRVSDRATEHEQ